MLVCVYACQNATLLDIEPGDFDCYHFKAVDLLLLGHCLTS